MDADCSINSSELRVDFRPFWIYACIKEINHLDTQSSEESYMKKSSYSKILILAVLLVILAIPTVAYAQESTPTPAPLPPNPAFNSSTLISELGTWQSWVVLLVTLVCGALGGLVYELLILQGNIERPHPTVNEEWTDAPQYAITKNLYDLGIWARLTRRPGRGGGFIGSQAR